MDKYVAETSFRAYESLCEVQQAVSSRLHETSARPDMRPDAFAAAIHYILKEGGYAALADMRILLEQKEGPGPFAHLRTALFLLFRKCISKLQGVTK